MIRIWDTGGEIELVDDTKNGKKRYVPLNKTIQELFGNLGREDGRYVFLSTRGERLKSIRKPLATAFKRAQKAGVEKATFHDFRHSWASWMSDAGVNPYTIMEIGGWADLKILMRYLHRTRAERQKAVEKIDGILSQSSHLYAISAKVLERKDS